MSAEGLTALTYQFIFERRLNGRPIAIGVGEAKEKYTIHEEILCCTSPFFTAAVRKGWKEGLDCTIDLPDDQPQTFELYAQWLYGGKVLSRGVEKSKRHDEELGQLIDAFVFGEKVQDGNYRDAIIDAVIAYTNTSDKDGQRWYPASTIVDRAYRGTPAGSPLRKLLIDFHVYHGRAD